MTLIALRYDMEVNNELLRLISQREFNRFWSEQLKETLRRNRDKFLKIHFWREAYTRYPQAYAGRKKKRGAPLVDTGNLRRHILRRKHEPVKGTQHKATMRLKYSRPQKYNERAMRQRAWKIVRQRRISFEKALKVAYSKAGYGTKTRAMFDKRLKAMAPQEVEFLKEEIRKAFEAKVKEAMRKPKRKYRRKRGR